MDEIDAWRLAVLCAVFPLLLLSYSNPHPKSLGIDWLELWFCKKVYFNLQMAALQNRDDVVQCCLFYHFNILFNLIWGVMYVSSCYLQAHRLWRHGIVSRRRVFKNTFGPQPKMVHMRWSHRYFRNALFSEYRQLQHNALNYRQQRQCVSRAGSVPAGLVVILCHLLQILTRWPTFSDIRPAMCLQSHESQ